MSRRDSDNQQLWYACMDGDVSEVERLIESGADKSWIGEGNKTPLHIASYHNNVEVIKVLLRYGVNINEVDELNRSALYWATQFGYYDTALFLINNGIDINLADKENGLNPLLLASITGQLKIVKLLINNGANRNAKIKDGRTAIDLAKRDNHTEVVKYLSSLDNSEIRYKQALSEGQKIKLEITCMSIHGPPGSGKTCLQHLILNEDPPQTRESTDVLTPAVRASANKLFQPSNETCITRVDEEEFLERLSKGIHNVTPDTSTTDSPSTPSRSMSLTDSRSRRSSFMKLFRRRSPTAPSSLSSSPSASSSSSVADVMSPWKSVQYEVISHLSSSGEDDVVNESYLVRLIYCIDSGGQAAFHDIAPAFLRRNSLSIVTLRLIDKLDDSPNTEYVICGKHLKCHKRNQFTNRHIITSFARSLSSLSLPKSDSVLASHPQQLPNLLVMGTFQDRMHECTETLDDKNKSLKENLSYYSDMCIKTRYEQNVIHPINTMIVNGRLETASELNEIIGKCSQKFEVDVPVKWFYFQLAISREADATQCKALSRTECFKIAQECQMSEEMMEEALLFFDDLGMLFYYPKVLPETIFTHPGPLIKKVSNLISLTFLDDSLVCKIHYDLPGGSHAKLKERGLFTEDLLRRLDSNYVESLFSPQDLLKLLLHLLICAVIPLTNPVTYFIPCVLPWKQLSDSDVRSYSTVVDPLILSWDEKPIPYGLFTGLVNALLSRRECPLFNLNKNFFQCRNVISLEHRRGGWLILVDEVSQIVLYFTGEDIDCYHILTAVCSEIERTHEQYRYQLSEFSKGFYSSVCDHVHYVRCSGDHKDDKIRATCAHKVIYLESLKQINWFKIKSEPPCVGVVDPVVDCDWLDQVDDSLLRFDCSEDVLAVKSAIQGVKWYDLGLALKLNPPFLDDVKETYRNDVIKCRDEVIKRWLESREEASWRTLCSALCNESIDQRVKAKKIGKQHPKKQPAGHLEAATSSREMPLSSSVGNSSAQFTNSPPLVTNTDLPSSSGTPGITVSMPVQATSDCSGLSKTSDICQTPHECSSPHDGNIEYCYK